MANFITRMTLTPVNLSRLQWAFRDVKTACEEVVSALFVTACCSCGKDAIVDFVVRDGDVPTQIAYRCICSEERLFKDPDERDRSLDRSFEKEKIPFWYPCDVPLPIIQRERFQFLHELFTRRNLIALSTILNAIEGLEDPKVRDVMKLSFTAALDKCSRLKPLSKSKGNSRPSLSESWVAVRFYAPKMWQEVNPWYVFARSFERMYKGKKESNAKLKNAVLGSSYEELRTGNANVVILTGSADSILNKQLPEQSVDYVLTDPPFGAHIQYLALSTFWGAWLRFDFDYDNELVINNLRGKTQEDYEQHLGEILTSIRRVSKFDNYIHIFYHDIQGSYLHKMLKSMSKTKISPERVIHQPPPNSFGAAVRNIKRTDNGQYRGSYGQRKGRVLKGHCGSYIVRGRMLNNSVHSRYSVIEDSLQKKVAGAAYAALQIRGGSAPVGTLLHSVYQILSEEEILMYAQHSAEGFLKESIKEFALINKGQAQAKDKKIFTRDSEKMQEPLRMALLDAKSLYTDQRYQVYQSVLGRLQDNGITLDLIYEVEDKIPESDVEDHRTKRLTRLLRHFGELLNYESQLKEEPNNEVIWRKGIKTALFQVTDKEISVKALINNGEEQIESQVGTISDEYFESALHKWCENNQEDGKELIKNLNPIGESTLQSPPPKRLLLKVLENKELCPEHHLITLHITKGSDIEPRPGQFFHVICDPDGEETIIEDGRERGYALTLRRPFSVHRIHYTDFDRRLLVEPTIIPHEIKDVLIRELFKIDILYKVVGKGTKSLSKVQSGRYLDVIGPIGNGFDMKKVDTAVIVAGGIGVAPLVALAERLRYLGSNVFLYFGALKKDLLYPILSRSDSAVELGYANGTPEFLEVIKKEFMEIGAEEPRICTDDGSLGDRGTVTDILGQDIKSGSLPIDNIENINIFACGPSKMIKTLSKVASEYKIPCKVLLEEHMACGIGACLSCVCHIRGKNGKEETKRVCVDGPVFDLEKIIWQD
jgi:dihydroorotate dehydrogenase electron transfer subunit